MGTGQGATRLSLALLAVPIKVGRGQLADKEEGEEHSRQEAEATEHVHGQSQHTSSRRGCKFRRLWDRAQKRRSLVQTGHEGVGVGPGCGGEGLPLDSVIVSWQLLKLRQKDQAGVLQGVGVQRVSFSSFSKGWVPGLGTMVC